MSRYLHSQRTPFSLQVNLYHILPGLSGNGNQSNNDTEWEDVFLYVLNISILWKCYAQDVPTLWNAVST